MRIQGLVSARHQLLRAEPRRSQTRHIKTSCRICSFWGSQGAAVLLQQGSDAMSRTAQMVLLCSHSPDQLDHSACLLA